MQAMLLWCVLFMLTVLAVSTSNLRSGKLDDTRALDADIRADFTVKAGMGVRFSGPYNLVYKRGAGGDSGCGADLQKCSCTGDNDTLRMVGQGTTGTETGLSFTCEFNVDNNPCSLHWEEWWVSSLGKNAYRRLTWDCQELDHQEGTSFTLSNSDFPSFSPEEVGRGR